MYNSNNTVTITLTADEAVALLRNRNSDWTIAKHLTAADTKIADAVTEALNVHHSQAQHDYAIKHT